jgi:hypothetical protein
MGSRCPRARMTARCCLERPHTNGRLRRSRRSGRHRRVGGRSNLPNIRARFRADGGTWIHGGTCRS